MRRTWPSPSLPTHRELAPWPEEAATRKGNRAPSLHRPNRTMLLKTGPRMVQWYRICLHTPSLLLKVQDMWRISNTSMVLWWVVPLTRIIISQLITIISILWRSKSTQHRSWEDKQAKSPACRSTTQQRIPKLVNLSSIWLLLTRQLLKAVMIGLQSTTPPTWCSAALWHLSPIAGQPFISTLLSSIMEHPTSLWLLMTIKVHRITVRALDSVPIMHQETKPFMQTIMPQTIIQPILPIITAPCWRKRTKSS